MLGFSRFGPRFVTKYNLYETRKPHVNQEKSTTNKTKKKKINILPFSNRLALA